MKDPAQVVKDILVDAAIGTFNAASGWAITVGEMKQLPETLVLINQTGGLNPYPHLLINQPSVQVIVRGARSGYVAARAKANDVVNALLGLTPFEHGDGDTYQSCIQLGDIAYIGQDENTRPLFSMNFRFIVLPAVEAGSNRVAIT